MKYDIGTLLVLTKNTCIFKKDAGIYDAIKDSFFIVLKEDEDGKDIFLYDLKTGHISYNWWNQYIPEYFKKVETK